MLKRKNGIINPNGVSLEKHEYDTVLFLTTLGYDVELIPPSHIPNRHTPDFKMNGLEWEMKSPKGKSRSALKHLFDHSKSIKHLLVITKERKMLEFDK